MKPSFYVLSLEDSDMDFEIISEQLINAGFNLNISRAQSEKEFMSLILKRRFDFILADNNLPQFSAFEALKIRNKHCPEVPFICVTGSIGENMARELFRLGAVDYVLKDNPEKLPIAIKKAMDEAKEKSARRRAEYALKENENRFNKVAEDIRDSSFH